MKTFLFKGDMAQKFGSSISLDVQTMREALIAFFYTQKGFKKYYLDKMSSGVTYVFIDSSNNVLENFCSDLILQDDVYEIVPNFEASGGLLGMAGNFGMNALVGYGLQKLIGDLTPVESTGEEYEIITTNSFIYTSNENRTEQGLPIPVVYGQLRVGSLVINSNIQNYDFDHENLTIYKGAQEVSSLPNIGQFNFNEKAYEFSTSKNLRGTPTHGNVYLSDESDTFSRVKGRYDGDLTKKPPHTYNNKDGSKIPSAEHGNQSFNNDYSHEPGQGGHKETYGPSLKTPRYLEDTKSSSKFDAGSAAKPYLFPPEGAPELDGTFRPNNHSDICISIKGRTPLSPQEHHYVLGYKTKTKPMMVGKRGNYQKLESIGVFRSVDVLSEGPIAGFAIPETGRSSYNDLGYFENDNGSISLGYQSSSEVVFVNNTATVGSVTFDDNLPNNLSHFIDTTKFRSNGTRTNVLTLENAGSGYLPNLDVNIVADGTQQNGISILIDRPSASESAEFGDTELGDEPITTPDGKSYFVSSNNLYNLQSIYSKGRFGELSLNFLQESNYQNPLSSFIIEETIDHPDTGNSFVAKGLNLSSLNEADLDNTFVSTGGGYSNREDKEIVIEPPNSPVILQPKLDKNLPFDRRGNGLVFDMGSLSNINDLQNKIDLDDEFAQSYINIDKSTKGSWGEFIRPYADLKKSFSFRPQAYTVKDGIVTHTETPKKSYDNCSSSDKYEEVIGYYAVKVGTWKGVVEIIDNFFIEQTGDKIAYYAITLRATTDQYLFLKPAFIKVLHVVTVNESKGQAPRWKDSTLESWARSGPFYADDINPLEEESGQDIPQDFDGDGEKDEDKRYYRSKYDYFIRASSALPSGSYNHNIHLCSHIHEYALKNGYFTGSQSSVNDWNGVELELPLGLLLQVPDLSESLFNAFNAKKGFAFKPINLPTGKDSKDISRTSKYFKITPAAGSDIPNTNPTYFTSRSNANLYKMTQNRAVNLCRLLDKGVIPGQTGLEAHRKGYYIPDLVYRIEVFVIRKVKVGNTENFLYKTLLTNIDAFAAISSIGTIRGLFVKDVPDNCVYDSISKNFTPLLFGGNTQQPGLNPFPSLSFSDNAYVDCGFFFKIDSSQNFKKLTVDIINGSVAEFNAKTSNTIGFTDWTNYVTNSPFAFPQDTPGLVCHGVAPTETTEGGEAYRVIDINSYAETTVSKTLANGGNYGKIKAHLEVIPGQNPFSENFDQFRFCTGRVKKITRLSPGNGYLGLDGNIANGESVSINIFNDSVGLRLVTIINLLNKNTGYRPNSDIIVHFGISSSDNLRIPIQVLDKSLIQYGRVDEQFNYWNRLFPGKLKLRTDENGKVSFEGTEVIDPGYAYTSDVTSGNARMIIPSLLLASKGTFDPLPHSTFLSESFSYFQTQGAVPQITYSLADLVNYSSNDTTSPYRVDFLSSKSFKEHALDPEDHFAKSNLRLIIPKENIVGGKLKKLFQVSPGQGFNKDFIGVDPFENTSEINFPTFNIKTDSLGRFTQVSVVHSENINGYSLDDTDLIPLISSPPSKQINLETKISDDPHNWARSIYLNSTPIRDKFGFFNFSKFEFDLMGGYTRNGLDSKFSNVFDKNEISSSLRKNIMEKEFRLPAQTHFINYPLYGPRNDGEKDYYYTHTVKNPEVSAICLSFKINELHYIYEGDESIVYLNLRPLVGGIIGYIAMQQLFRKVISIAIPDPQIAVTSTAVQVVPCIGSGAGTGASVGANPPALSGIADVVAIEALKELAASALGILGAVLGVALAKEFPCSKSSGGFLCIKMGEIIKNSGEIWPAKIFFKIEYGIEGDRFYNYELVIQGCATNEYIKDVYIPGFSQLVPDHKHGKFKKNRIIKISRMTRAMDPVANGISDARFKMQAELQSVTEYVAGFFSYPNTAMVATRVNSKDMPQAPRREYLIKGKMVKVPNGYAPSNGSFSQTVNSNSDTFFSEEVQWTSNPSWIIFDLLTNPIYGLGKYGITEDQIDKWSFLDFAKRADEPVTVYIDGIEAQERRYMCNLYLDTEKEAFRYIKELMNIYDASINFSGGKIYISTDKPSDPVMLFNNANVSESGFSYSTIPKTNRITAVTVDYLDERDNYMQKTEYLEEESAIREHGYSHAKIAGIGITRKGEANRLAMSKLMQSKMATEVIQFTVGLHGGYLRIGDVIEVMDNNKISQHSGGRIISRINNQTIEIDVPTDAIAGAQKIQIQQYAESTEPKTTSEGEEEEVRPAQYQEYNISQMNGFEVTIQGSLHSSIKSSYIWVVKDYNDSNNDPIQSKLYRIKEIKESEDSQYSIVALLYDPRKYDYVDGPSGDSGNEDEYIGHQIGTSHLKGANP